MRLSWRGFSALTAVVLLGMGAVALWAQEGTPGAQPVAVPAAAPDPPKAKDGLVELAPTPMLDEEGRQRLDPEGQPMWNPPVRQQRDKKGRPLFDEDGKPVMQTATELGYDEHGKRLHAKKEKPAKTVAISVSEGTLTVDGLIGKAALNYEIADFRYIYFYAPWVGTVVVSNVMFPGAKEQPGGFDQRTLTVKADEHEFQLWSAKPLLGKRPAAAFVAVNRDFVLPTKMPVMGYGMTLKPPYAWPGSKEGVTAKNAPPVPAGLRPVMLLAPCPAGQMRAAAKPVLPGEAVPVQPCTAITGGMAVVR